MGDHPYKLLYGEDRLVVNPSQISLLFTCCLGPTPSVSQNIILAAVISLKPTPAAMIYPNILSLNGSSFPALIEYTTRRDTPQLPAPFSVDAQVKINAENLCHSSAIEEHARSWKAKLSTDYCYYILGSTC
jgi:hypothetical protein